ncbi:hypothetical protein D3C75_1072290 [compost metagenome]
MYYAPETAELVRMKPPTALLEEQIFKSALLEKKLELTLPDSNYLEANNLMITKQTWTAIHWNSDRIYLRPRGRIPFSGPYVRAVTRRHSSEEIQLFQADSDYDLWMEWETFGLLHFFIKANDFKELHFENVYTCRVET